MILKMKYSLYSILLILPAFAHGANELVEKNWEHKMDLFFGEYIVGPLAALLFWPIPGIEMPLVVAWLLSGALFFTIRMRFVNVRLFKHAIELIRGKYDSPNQVGEVTHFQALTTALSATVGLGNIAGVAIAIGTGGPGATFWMILVGFLGDVFQIYGMYPWAKIQKSSERWSNNGGCHALPV